MLNLDNRFKILDKVTYNIYTFEPNSYLILLNIMRSVDTSKFSMDECWGVQINGLSHCNKINCKWQGLTACEGKNIIKTGVNSKGYRIGEHGLVENFVEI